MKKIDKMLVIGDLIIDILIEGKVIRISPEAPIPILDVKKKTLSLGGVGNIIDYFFSKKENINFILFVGKKNYFKEIFLLLKKYKSFINKIFIGNVNNIIKYRYAANNQYILRADEHENYSVNLKYHNHVIKFLKNSTINYVCISDYNKGNIDNFFLKRISEICRLKGIKIILDTKKKNFEHLKDIFLITPNLSEIKNLCKLDQKTPLKETINQVIKFKKKNNIENILITMSEDGAVLINKRQNIKKFPTIKKIIYDVTGAGDVLFSSIIYNLLKKYTLEKSIQIAVREATRSVEIFGKISENKFEIQI